MKQQHNSQQEPDDLMHQALKIFGDVWNLSIVRVLSGTAQRFTELQRNLGNVSPTTLTDRLKKLESYGLVVQEKQTIDQMSVIYTLTDKGKKMLPILRAIESFSKKFL
jgi:DNA-binding HxlR family transcriptional regulator